MKISLFTSWQVRCGIADYGAHLVDGLQQIPDTQITVVPFDGQKHPRADYLLYAGPNQGGDPSAAGATVRLAAAGQAILRHQIKGEPFGSALLEPAASAL